MKVTVELPDKTLVMTYQYVFLNDESGQLAIRQNVFDSKKLGNMKEATDEQNA